MQTKMALIFFGEKPIMFELFIAGQSQSSTDEKASLYHRESSGTFNKYMFILVAIFICLLLKAEQ